MWSIGDIVWAKINDDWWPGVISNPENYKYVMVGENKIFVKRFGDLQGLEVESGDLLDFEKHFADKSIQKLEKPFTAGIQEAVTVIASRHKIFRDISEKWQWANSGFQAAVNILPTESPNTVLHNSKKCIKRKKKHVEQVDKKKRRVEQVDKIRTKLQAVRNGSKSLTEICIMCCKEDSFAKHPLFIGGVCSNCSDYYCKAITLLRPGKMPGR